MEPWLLAIVVLVALAWYVVRPILRWLRRAEGRALPDITDAAQQLGFVSRVEFERQPLLNKSEFQVLLVLEEVVRELCGGHRVMAQTSLGEILRPKGPRGASIEHDLAFRSINSKRVDFVIVDASGLPVLAVEYQGTGHYRGNAVMRDAVKREAFRSAGVALIEVPATYVKRDVARDVRAVVEASRHR